MYSDQIDYEYNNMFLELFDTDLETKYGLGAKYNQSAMTEGECWIN